MKPIEKRGGNFWLKPQNFSRPEFYWKSFYNPVCDFLTSYFASSKTLKTSYETASNLPFNFPRFPPVDFVNRRPFLRWIEKSVIESI